MHALNPTAALVFEHCDGQTTPAELATRLETDLNVPDAEKLVWLSLDRLEKAHLLEEKVPPGNGKRGLTRREVLKMAGISLALLPVVKSIVLPTPMLAASCSVNCTFFTNNSLMNDCTASCTAVLFPFETLCSVQQTNGDCECNVYSTDLVGSGCAGGPISQEERRR